MAVRKINWGILGLGRIAAKFAADLQLVSDAQLYAVASNSVERAKSFAQQFGATHYFGSYEALMNCPYLDVVYIATPHVLHCKNTLMCLQKRLPVLCEKPAAMNVIELQQMLDLAAKNKTFFMEALWTRFIPAFQKAMQFVQTGLIGEPLSVKADFGFNTPFDPIARTYNKDLGGGSLLDVGLYPVFLALEVLGKPTEIQAMARFSSTGIDENCTMLLRHERGGLSMLHSSFVMKTNTEAFIYGEKGSIYLHPRFHHPSKITLHLNGLSPQEFSLPHAGYGYQFEIAEVNRCLKKNLLASPLMDGAKSLLLLQTLDTIRQKIGLIYPQDKQ